MLCVLGSVAPRSSGAGHRRLHGGTPRAERGTCLPALRARGCQLTALACLGVWLWTSHAHAFHSLFDVVRPEAQWSALVPDSETRAALHDGVLLGVGTERIRRSTDGNLRIERTRHYTHVRHPKTGRVVSLPEPWEVTALVVVTPRMRLLSCDTHFRFKRSADNVLGDYKLSEHHAWFFEKDRSLLRASQDGKKLIRQDYLGSKLVNTERSDYPPRALPVEILCVVMSLAVQRKIDEFDFELIVPGGDTHGVRAQVHRTRDVRRFAKGYPVPAKRQVTRETLAVIDMHLASPFKSLFFPHHFYVAYANAEPSKLMMVWGGDPAETVQAFRID